MSDYDNRAARGQAYNLAVQNALHNGESENVHYIASKFIFYFKLGRYFQDVDIKFLEEEVKKNESN